MIALAESVENLTKALHELLAVTAATEDKYYPPREERTSGWKAPFQVRCEGCSRFATIVDCGDGYDSRDGTYEPWFTVNCKRCGEQDGYIAST